MPKIIPITMVGNGKELFLLFQVLETSLIFLERLAYSNLAHAKDITCLQNIAIADKLLPGSHFSPIKVYYKWFGNSSPMSSISTKVTNMVPLISF